MQDLREIYLNIVNTVHKQLPFAFNILCSQKIGRQHLTHSDTFTICCTVYYTSKQFHISFSKFPSRTTQGTYLFHILLRFQPLHNTLHMKCMSTCSPQRWTVIPRIFNIRCTCFKCHSAYSTYLQLYKNHTNKINYIKNSTYIFIYSPFPYSGCMPSLYLYLHL